MSKPHPMARRKLPTSPAGNNALRQARIRRNLTQQLLADFTQLGLSTIERAERGQRIRMDSCRRLCEFFGASAEELGLLRVPEPALKPEELEPETHALAPIISLVAWKAAHQRKVYA